jgi:hypothetical protein
MVAFFLGPLLNSPLPRAASRRGSIREAIAAGQNVPVMFSLRMTNEHPASWRMPSQKHMEKLMREHAGTRPAEAPDPPPSDPMPEQLWDAVLRDPRAAGKPWLPIQQCRLSEISRHVLRIGYQRCSRIVEIQKADALRFYGPHAIWKDVGQRLLDQTCSNRTGRHEEDGCWPDWAIN